MAKDTTENQEQFDYETEIWNVADYVWGPIKTSEFNRVILPFTMLRRLECALEPTRDAVVKAYEEHPDWWVPVEEEETDKKTNEANFCLYSQKPFFNITSFRLNNLGSTDTYTALMQYINGFSANCRDILKKFKIEETCRVLDENGLLYGVCGKFAAFNLSPEAVSDRDMSNIYEHLIRRFGESIAENAEDFMTPKDVVRLAVGMIFAGEDELANSDTGIVRTIYDPTLGTGGFITDALDQLDEWHKDKNMIAPAKIVPYGQEYESESWAMAKTALLLRSVGKKDADTFEEMTDMSANIMWGDTLSDDKFENKTFNYILSNPPYGKKWEKEEDDVKEEAKLGFKGRFGAGLPSIDDGSMLFLQHVVSKLPSEEEGGGKAGIVLSASPLFTGDAGSGPSNIRRWLFENDYIDCIVKLPESIFYRTGINTYLWILSTKKPSGRKGKIQLIDASDNYESLMRNQGNKRFYINDAQREWIIKTYIDGHDHGKSVIVPKETFMYRKVTTQRPLHAQLEISEETLDKLLHSRTISKLNDENKAVLRQYLAEDLLEIGPCIIPYNCAESTAKAAREEMKDTKITVAQITKAIQECMIVKDDSYPIIRDKKGNIIPDPDLKDTENIPFGESFDDYMSREVLPFTPDCWIDETVLDKGTLADGNIGIVGTSISFNKFFYKHEEPRKPNDIAAELLRLENGLGNFIKELLQ